MKSLAILIFLSIFAGHSALGLERKSFIVKNMKELNSLKRQADSKSVKGAEKEWLQWQLALNAPLLDQNKMALDAIQKIERLKVRTIGQDQLCLTKGRIYFQMNQFDRAIEQFQKVEKTSEYWFEAVEEEAWSYIRLGQHNKATGKLATLLNPLFATWVGPETYFAANYNSLKICDYTSILKLGIQFKERSLQRIQELETLAKTKGNSKTESAISKMLSTDLGYLTFSDEASALPRFFWRDQFIVEHVLDLKKSSKIQSLKKQRSAITKIKDRLAALAKSELSEYQTVVNKLQIIEAEVIQRLYLDESLQGVRPPATEITKSSDDLVFPYSDEVWLDEIDKYQAKIKVCPQLKEAHL